MRFSEGVERGIEHGELAVRAASRVDDVALRCRALAAYGLMQFNAGRGIPSAEMEEALALERSLAEWPLDDGPTMRLRPPALVVGGRRPCAGALPGGSERVATARNDPRREAERCGSSSFLEWRAGNWEEADRYAADSRGALRRSSAA